MKEPTPRFCNLAMEIKTREHVVSSGKGCDLYLEGTRFESQSGQRKFSVSVFLPSTSKRMLQQYFKLGPGRFLPHYFKFISH
jgi:hypothetical protein